MDDQALRACRVRLARVAIRDCPVLSAFAATPDHKDLRVRRSKLADLVSKALRAPSDLPELAVPRVTRVLPALLVAMDAMVAAFPALLACLGVRADLADPADKVRRV